MLIHFPLAHAFHRGMADHEDNKPFGGFGGFGGFGFGDFGHFTEETTSRRKYFVLMLI